MFNVLLKFGLSFSVIIIGWWIWRTSDEKIENEIKSALILVRKSNFYKALEKLKKIVNNNFEVMSKEKRVLYAPIIQGMLGCCYYNYFLFNIEEIEILEKSKLNFEKALNSYPKQAYKKDYYIFLFGYAKLISNFAFYENEMENLIKSKEILEVIIQNKSKVKKSIVFEVYYHVGLCFLKIYEASGDCSYLHKAEEYFNYILKTYRPSRQRNSELANTKMKLAEVYYFLSNESPEKHKFLERAEQVIKDCENYYTDVLRKISNKTSNNYIIVKGNLSLCNTIQYKINGQMNCFQKAEAYYEDIFSVMKERNLTNSVLYRDFNASFNVLKKLQINEKLI